MTLCLQRHRSRVNFLGNSFSHPEMDVPIMFPSLYPDILQNNSNNSNNLNRNILLLTPKSPHSSDLNFDYHSLDWKLFPRLLRTRRKSYDIITSETTTNKTTFKLFVWQLASYFCLTCLYPYLFSLHFLMTVSVYLVLASRKPTLSAVSLSLARLG